MAEPLLHLGDVVSFERAFVAAVARIECTHTPTASAVIPVTLAYFMTMLR
jgi:hypothetical protein